MGGFSVIHLIVLLVILALPIALGVTMFLLFRKR